MKKKRGYISKNRRRKRITSVKGIYKKGIDMEYEFCLKVGYTGENCKLNTHLAIESQIERKGGNDIFIPSLLFKI